MKSKSQLSCLSTSQGSFFANIVSFDMGFIQIRFFIFSGIRAWVTSHQLKTLMFQYRKLKYFQLVLQLTNQMQEQKVGKPKAIVKKKMNKYGQGTPEGLPKAMGGRYKAQGFGSFNISNIRERLQNLENKKRQNQELGFISNKEIYGNDKDGEEWVEEQKKRKQNDELYSDKEDCEKRINDDQQIIYIQPSSSEGRLAELRKMGRNFYDQNFPPNQYSLTGAYGNIPSWEPINWDKMSENIDNIKIFEGKVQPKDIMQGFLGDCYFLAGLAALAERPDRIYDLFLLNETNQLNYYSVKMLYRGKWRTIDLDQHVPFAYGSPAFSKSKNNQVWVMILEKAWAKLYGSYKQLEGGFPEQPLHDLTGAPIKNVFLQNALGDNQWEYLYESSIKEYAMVASSNPGSDTDQSSSGIFQGHAYTFLNATQANYKNKKYRIVQLRNPWGKGEFKGRWSDLDPVWSQISEEQKKRLGFKKNAEDGIFFMGFEDFMHEFKNVTVAEINDNASYVYDYFVDPEAKGAYFFIEVKTASKYSLHVDKTPQRSFTGEMQQNYRYPEAHLEFGKIEANKVERFRGLISSRRTLFKSFDLTPGNYVAWVKIDFDPNYDQDFEVVLAVYSQYACQIRLATPEEATQFNKGKEAGWMGRRYRQDEMPAPKTKSRDPGRMRNKKRNGDFASGDLTGGINKKNSFSTNTMHSRPESHSQEIKDPKHIISEFKKRELSGKKKKIRRIEVERTKHETIEECPNGKAVIKSRENQIKTQSVETKVEHGINTKKKQMENEIITEETRFQGQVQYKNQKIKERLTISEQDPFGKIKEKTSTKEKEVETVQEDDDGTDSYLRSELNLANGEESSIKKAQSLQKNNFTDFKQLAKQNDPTFNDRNKIRYLEESDDEEIET